MKNKSIFILILLILFVHVSAMANNAVRSVSFATDKSPVKESLRQRYFNYSGRGSLSILSVGGTYSFMDTTHHVTVSLLDFRTGMFGMSPLAVEFAVGPFKNRVVYKPSVRLYVPVAKCISIAPYAGVLVDVSYLGRYVLPDFDYVHERDFFMNAYAGVAIQLSAIRRMPLELKVEYRHPLESISYLEFYPRGVYMSAQLYLGRTFPKQKRS